MEETMENANTSFDMTRINVENGIVLDGMFKNWRVTELPSKDKAETKYIFINNENFNGSDMFSFEYTQHGYGKPLDKLAKIACTDELSWLVFSKIKNLAMNDACGRNGNLTMMMASITIRDLLKTMPTEFYRDKYCRTSFLRNLRSYTKKDIKNMIEQGYEDSYEKVAQYTRKSFDDQVEKSLVDFESKTEKANRKMEKIFQDEQTNLINL